jgi:RNA polymerase sigma factor for flagellar operon FliA
MVRSLAWQLCRKLPKSVEMDDLIGEAQAGLLQAARDFDDTRGASFSTYAYWRIRGSMLDWIRAQRWFHNADFHAGTWPADAEGQRQSPPPAVRLSQEGAEELVDTHAPDPSAALLETEARDVLRGLIDKLDGLPRRVLDATLLQNKTLEEAGKAAGVHKGTAQRAQVRAFELLAEALRDKGLGDMDGEELRKLAFKNQPARRAGGQ